MVMADEFKVRSPSAMTTEPGVRRSRRIRVLLTWWGAIVFLGIVLLIAITPQVIGYYLKARATSLFAPYIVGDIQIHRVHVGWFSPLVIYGVTLRERPADSAQSSDPQTNTLATIETLRTELSLWQLMQRPQDLGTLDLEKVHARLQCTDHETNWERFLQPLLQLPPSQKPLQVAWRAREAVLVLADEQGSTLAECRSALIEGRWRRGSSTRLELSAELDISCGEHQGRIELDIQPAHDAAGSSTTAEHQITVTWNDVALETLGPLWQRLAMPVSATGLSSGSCQGSWGSTSHWRWSNVALRNARFHGRAFGEQPLPLQALNSSGQLTVAHERQQLQAHIDCDYGTVDVQAGDIQAEDKPNGFDWLPYRALASLTVDADVDMARLVASVPEAWRLRPDVTLQEGRVLLRVRSQPQPQAVAWRVELHTSDLVALRQGQQIRWREPIDLRVQLWADGNTLAVEDFACQSEFLTVRWQRDAQPPAVHVAGDLARLQHRLKEFFDWPIELQGRLEGFVRWQDDPQELRMAAELALHDAAIAVSDVMLFKEERSQARCGALLRKDVQNDMHVRELVLDWSSGTEHFTAQLTEPAPLSQLTQAAWHCRLAGELSAWQRRLFSSRQADAPWQLTGRVDVSGLLASLAPALTVRNLRVDIPEAQILTANGHHRLPALTLSVQTAQWNPSLQERSITLTDLQVQSSFLAASAPNLAISWPRSEKATSWIARGTVDFQADCRTLWQCYHAVRQTSPAMDLSGILTGCLAWDKDWRLEAKCEQWQIMQLNRPVAARQPVTNGSRESATVLWQDPQIQLTARGRTSASSLLVDQCLVQGGGWSVATSGAIEQLDSTPQVQLAGQVTYDWMQLRARSALLENDLLLVQGQRSDTFTLQGPITAREPSPALVPAQLQLRTRLGWQQAHVAGLVLGAGNIDVALDQAVLQLRTDQVPVQDGTAGATAWIDLRSQEPILIVASGRVLDSVELSPAVCRSWLKYIHPLVAEATRAQGRIGLFLDQCRVPLSDVAQTEIAGKLIVERGAVGPGPLAQEVIGAVERMAALVERKLPRLHALAQDEWIEMPPQQVPFQVRGERVYHQQLFMQVRRIPVTTQGSVGWDQSLLLDVDVQIPRDWVAGRPLLERLLQRPVRIPVRGTLTKPELDEKFFVDLGRQLLGNAPGQLLEEGLLRGLDRLLRDR